MLGMVLLQSPGVVFAQTPLSVVGVMSSAQRDVPRAALIRCAWPDTVGATHLVFEGESACGRYTLDGVDGASATVRDDVTGTSRTFELSTGAATPAERRTGVSSSTLDPSSPSFAVSMSTDRVQVRMSRSQLGASLSALPTWLAGTVVRPVTITTPAGPRVEGFELRALPSQGLMADLGLRDGDVLLELNGARVTGLAMVGGAAQGLLASGHATALVRRGESHMLFVVDAE